MVPPTTAAIDALAGASPPMSTWALTPIVQEVEVKYALAQVPGVRLTSRSTGGLGCVPFGGVVCGT